MHVIDHSTLPRHTDAGRQRFAAAAGRTEPLPFELWIDTLEINARAEVAPRDCHRVVLVSAGYGILQVDGAPQRFHAPCSLILPPGVECLVVNVGAEAMRMVVVCGAAPPDAPAAASRPG
ncbi:MAG: hypothetical protein WKG52_09700 [Variovorax sp.]